MRKKCSCFAVPLRFLFIKNMYVISDNIALVFQILLIKIVCQKKKKKSLKKSAINKYLTGNRTEYLSRISIDVIKTDCLISNTCVIEKKKTCLTIKRPEASFLFAYLDPSWRFPTSKHLFIVRHVSYVIRRPSEPARTHRY